MHGYERDKEIWCKYAYQFDARGIQKRRKDQRRVLKLYRPRLEVTLFYINLNPEDDFLSTQDIMFAIRLRIKNYKCLEP